MLVVKPLFCSCLFSTLDDQFVIYAALSSGPGCYVLSSDLFKGHRNIFNEMKLFWLFQRWQRLRQIKKPLDMHHFNFKSRKPFDLPLELDLDIQCNNGYWHVPVQMPWLSKMSSRFPLQGKWLCMKAF